MRGSAIVRRAKDLIDAASARVFGFARAIGSRARPFVSSSMTLLGRVPSRVAAFARGPGARTRLLALTATVAALAAISGASAWIGYWANEHDIPEKVQARYVEPTLSALGLVRQGGPIEVAWEPRYTNRQDLQVARFEVSKDSTPMAWALAPVGDNLVFSSRYGQLSYLDASLHLASLDLQVPMRIEELADSDVMRNPVFEIPEYRTFDLLSVETGPQTYDLYASHVRYTDRNCFEVAVSRTPLEVSPDGLKAATGVWDEIYVVNPCIALKTSGMVFAGHEGGGRLALKDPDTLLFSVGVFQYDNVGLGQLAGQDPSTDLGKIIAITLSTGEARIYASGFRNPQGLLVAANGEVWETEHGPQGGDEVNRIVEGGNYGWPFVTYGMDYGAPPTAWPWTATPGRHEGFAEPSFVFTPSIGISNIIEPDATEFPGWKGDLIAASLASTSLYALHRDGDRIVSAEPIPLERRLRDIVQMSDGRLAISTDDGFLIFVRNSTRPRDGFTVNGDDALPDPPPELFAGAQTTEQIGARAFQYNCGSCHSLTGQLGVGPPLNGVFDRRIASVEGYGYSEALRQHDEVWTPELVRSFLVTPGDKFQGTTMPRMVGVEGADLPQLIQYLQSTRAMSPPS